MLRLVLHRLRARPGVTVLSLLAIIVAVGFATSVPIFAQAVNRAILEEEMSALARDLGRSPLSMRAYYLPRSDQPLTSEQAGAAFEFMADTYSRNTGLSVNNRHMAISSSALLLKTADQSPYGPKGTFLANASLGFLVYICVYGASKKLATIQCRS